MSRTWRLLLWPLLVVAAVGASFAYLDMDTAGLFSGKGLGQMAAYASEFFPPDLSAPHLRAIGRGLLETLAMSAIGTLLAALLGLLFALPAAGRFGVPAQSLARLLLNALRAVPELVWGALMVLAAGLGPNAGTLALALHTGGVLGRLFAEALENTPAQPAEAGTGTAERRRQGQGEQPVVSQQGQVGMGKISAAVMGIGAFRQLPGQFWQPFIERRRGSLQDGHGIRPWRAGARARRLWRGSAGSARGHIPRHRRGDRNRE